MSGLRDSEALIAKASTRKPLRSYARSTLKLRGISLRRAISAMVS